MNQYVKLIRKIRRAVALARHDQPLGPPTEADRAAQARLREEFESLTAPDSGAETSPAGREWAENMRRLHELVAQEDARSFLRWDVISRTMFVDDAIYISREFAELRSRADAAERWLPVLEENRAGNPVPFWEYPRTSGNLIHHAYHVARFEDFLGGQVSDFAGVFEFGGGYGSMCRLWRRLGFTGDYVILDLPPVSALQRYYLRQLDQEEGFPKCQPVTVTSRVEEAREIIEPLLGDGRPVLFLSTWALSETPLEVRATVEDLVKRASGWLLAFQARFGEVENRGYFERLVEARPDAEAEIMNIEHVPGSAYAFLRARSLAGP